MSSHFSPENVPDLFNAPLAENEVRRQPLPPGETIAQIVDMKATGGTSKKTNQPWNRLDITLQLIDPEYLQSIPGNDGSPVKTTLGIMLDMDNGAIAVGPNKNIRLGRLRSAAGVNGKPLSALNGQMLKVQIIHKPHPTEAGVVLDEIAGFAAI